MKARGYTMMEIAIVLLIVMMLSSLLITNYYSYDKDTRNKEATRQAAQIKTAIVNYATTHSTAQRFVEVVNISIDLVAVPPLSVTVRAHHLLPAGRPYLPCPDISGDGYEDRILPIAAATVISVTVDAMVIYVPGGYPLETSGGCVSSRGIVPWRTLDTPPADPWGNRYSYRVAGLFSNANTGFDQHSTGGAHYAGRPLLPEGVNARVTAGLNITDATDTPIAESGPWNMQGFKNYLAPSIICDSAPCPSIVEIDAVSVTVTLSPDIIAGSIAPAALTLFDASAADFDGVVETPLTMSAFIDGVPFVVISHGENGNGGVRSDIPGYVCNLFPALVITSSTDSTAVLDEMQNAVWLLPDTNISVGISTYKCAQVGSAMPMLEESTFVAGINSGRAHTGRSGYDDIVSWMSTSEMIAELTERQALPVHLLPPIGLEQ